MINTYRIAALTILSICACLQWTSAQSLPQGSTTVARSRGDAIVIWDATATLTDLVAKRASKKEVLSQLQSDAALIFESKAGSLIKSAKTLSVIVLYEKLGSISPTYHTATFEGVERLLIFKAPTRLARNGRKWASDLLRGRAPHGAFVTVGGNLPPEIH